MSATTDSWRAVHVYRWTGQDRLLVDAIGPLARRLTAEGTINGFFFLRYWQGGPHVRLRLLGGPDSVAIAAPFLRDHLAAHPHERQPPVMAFADTQQTLARLENAEPAAELVPPDTVREEPYRPELAKYGGPAGVAVAERLFHASSDIVVDELRSVADVETRRLGVAFGMLVAALDAVPPSVGAVPFLRHYSAYWRRYVPDGAERSWEDSLAENRHALTRSAERVLAGVLPDGVARWAAALRATWSALLARQRDVLPAVTLTGETDAERLDYLLFNYVHTHNNRLGVIPMREAYLAFLGHRVLGDLTGVSVR